MLKDFRANVLKVSVGQDILATEYERVSNQERWKSSTDPVLLKPPFMGKINKFLKPIIVNM